MEYIILIIISICFTNICLFIFGVFIGKLIFSYTNNIDKPKSFFDQNTINKKLSKTIDPISIDDKKIVLGIDTNNMEKKYNKIAETTSTENDIVSSVNKLKNMKG